MSDPDQLSLLGEAHDALLPSTACSVRAQLQCDNCGVRVTRSFSCVRPCRGCPWRRGRVTPLVRRLPVAPIRHWVLTLPSPWRETLVRDPGALRKFRLGATKELLATIERHSRAEGHAATARAGAAVVLHPASGDLALNVHLHLLIPDGVYAPADGVARRRFRAFATPVPRAALEDAACRIRDLLLRLAPAPDQPLQPLPTRRPMRLPSPPDPIRAPKNGAPDSSEAVDADGVRLHRSPPIAASDRQSLARVAAYVTRPLVHPAAIARPSDSVVALRLQRPGRDSAVRLEFPAPEFDRRLAEITAVGAGQTVSYHGAMANRGPRDGGNAQLELVQGTALAPTESRPRWRCDACHGRMEVVALERV